jgi:hypothetical protein
MYLKLFEKINKLYILLTGHNKKKIEKKKKEDFLCFV